MNIKKPLAVTVILLFIGVAFAPSIHANIGKEMVEFTAEGSILEIGDISGGIFIKAEILNGHPWDLTNVEWSITVDQGYIFFGREKTGVIEEIPGYRKATVKSFVFGFGGTIVISVYAEASSGPSAEQSVLAQIFGPFTFGIDPIP